MIETSKYCKKYEMKKKSQKLIWITEKKFTTVCLGINIAIKCKLSNLNQYQLVKYTTKSSLTSLYNQTGSVYINRPDHYPY